MDSREKRALESLLSSEGFALFKNLVFKDRVNGVKSLENQIKDKLISATRGSDWEKAAYYTGQLDILAVVMNLPEHEYNRA